MWELYDALIEAARREMSHAPAKGSTGEDKAAAINHSPTVTAARISPIWTTVRAALDALSEDAPAAGTIGLALTLDEPSGRHPTRCGNLAGTPLTELMADVKSWNFADASLGLAAINAVVNRPEAFPTTNDNPRVIVGERTGIFGGFEQLVHGRRVCLVGHAPFAERLAHICELTILERIPREGDLPDPACEYVLPSQDLSLIHI